MLRVSILLLCTVSTCTVYYYDCNDSSAQLSLWVSSPLCRVRRRPTGKWKNPLFCNLAPTLQHCPHCFSSRNVWRKAVRLNCITLVWMAVTLHWTLAIGTQCVQCSLEVKSLRCALINYLILPEGRRPRVGGEDPPRREVKRKRGVEVLVKRSRDPAGSKDKVREPGWAKIIWGKEDETDGKSKNYFEFFLGGGSWIWSSLNW